MKASWLAIILTIINLVVLVALLTQVRPMSAPAAADVLRVEALELVDGSGQVRAQLNVEPGGEVVFRLRDASGTIRVKLGASEDGSGLDLLNHLTEPGIQLLANQESTRLSLTGPGGAQEIIEP